MRQLSQSNRGSNPAPDLAGLAPGRTPLIMALEPRIMFDGAALATALHVPHIMPDAHNAGHAKPLEVAHEIAHPFSVPPAQAPAIRPALEVGNRLATASIHGNAQTAAPVTQVLVVDGRIPEYQQVVAAAQPGVKVIVLNPNQDGVQQIADALRGLHDVQSISIVSHGAEGVLLLGDSALFGDNLTAHSAQLQAIGQALRPNGDILLYGCDVGAGSDGMAFMASLATATGAHVAASNDNTGGITAGGNWNLEIATGSIDYAPALNAAKLGDYDHLLITTTVNSVAALKAAIATGIGDGVDDVITLTSNITFASSSDTIAINVTDGHKLSIVGGGFTLSGGNLARVLSVSTTNSGSAVGIDNLTITNGLAVGAGGSNATGGIGGAGGNGLGGAIFNSGALTITNSTITANKASGGGGGGGTSVGLYGGGGGGGGGFGAGSGGAGGIGAGGQSPGAISGITGGTGGGAGGRGGYGGSSTGGGGSTYSFTGYTAGGSGGTANNGSISIGGGGGGTGTDRAGGAGGSAVGGIYNASTGVLTITGSSITNNIGAGGAGGGGGSPNYASTGNGGNGGVGVGGIWNKGGIVNLDSSTNSSLSTGNAGGGGHKGLASGGTNANGSDGATTNTLTTTNGGTQNTNFAPPPSITSATYNDGTGVLAVTATNMTGGDTIAVNKISLSGEGGSSYTLTTGNVTASSGTSFSVSLNATDQAAVDVFLNKNGTTSTGGTTFNLSAASSWDATTASSADATNGVTVSNVPAPTITSAAYDESTGVITVTGAGLLSASGASNDIVANKFTLTGEGGATYTLTNTSNVEITSGSSFTLTLSATDKAQVNQVLNKNGTSSTGGTTYNLAAAEDWNSGADAAVVIADVTGNGVTASNVAVPTITSATYNESTGVVTVTGTGFLSAAGASNDIVANKFTLVGEGGSTYTLTDTSNVDVTSGTSFTLTLSATDQAAINQILNKNGTSSTGGTTYNLAAAEDWNSGADSAVVIADTTGNAITVSNVALPTITSAAYDESAGVITVTGAGFLLRSGASNDIVANKFTVTGEGGATYTLTDSSNVDITSGTLFTLALSVTDKAAVNQILNKNGTSSTGGTTYNLAAAEDWNSGADAAVVIADTTGNGMVVSNANSPPAVTNLNGDSVAWAGGGSTVVLDSGGNATVTDTELGALNSGNGDWAGASMTVRRSGTAISTDTLGFNTSGALFTVSGNTLQAGGLTFATFTNTGGVLAVTYTSSGTSATTALVNDVAQRITYRNDTPSGDATLRFSVSDGAATTTADVTVASDTIFVTNASDTATIDITNGVSFSEAIGIAAADVTGNQTIAFAGSLASTTLVVGGVTLNESLTFDMGSASGMSLTTGTINIAGGTLTLNNGPGAVATVSSTLGGIGALTKAGFGTVTLSNGSNSYSGATTVATGTLTVTGGNAISNASAVDVAGGATLSLSANETVGNLSGSGVINVGNSTLTSTITADTTFAGNIIGAGGFTLNQTGAATHSLTLSGTNTYTGTTVLANYAWVKLNGDASISNSSSLRFNGNTRVTLLSDQTVGSLSSAGSLATLDLGTYTLTAGGDNTSTTVLGVISGTGALTKQGAGSMILSGTNTYTGLTTIAAGTLTVNSGASIANTDAVSVASGATFDIGASETIGSLAGAGSVTLGANTLTTGADNTSTGFSGGISGTGGALTKTGSGTLTLSGTNSYTGATGVSGGALGIATDSNLGAGTVTLSAGTTLALTGATTIDNAIALSGNATVDTSANATLSGNVTGAGGLTKAGISSLTLSGSNSFTGTTNLSAGTLVVSGDLSGTSGLTVASGATLAGSGSVFATSSSNTLTVQSGGTLSPGLGTGVMTINGNLSMASGSTLAVDINGSVAGTGYDQVIVDGTVNVSGANLSVTHGYTAGSADSYDIIVNDASDAVTGAFSGVSEGGSVIAGGDSTHLTASYVGGTGNDFSLTAPTFPSVTSVSTITPDGVYKVGDTITVVVNFSEAIHLSTGTIQLTLETGSSDEVLSYLAGSGTSTLYFNYTVQAGDQSADLDYTSTAALSANGDTIQNATFNDAILTLPAPGASGSLGANADLVVDGVAPTVTSVAVPASATYIAGQNLDLTVNYSEAVTVNTGGGTPYINVTLDTGGTVRASYLSGSGSGTLIFRYTVTNGDLDTNGITVGGSIADNGGTLEDGAGNIASPTLNSVASTAGVLVDAVAPAVSSVSVPVNGTYVAGQNLDFTVNYSETVTVNTGGGTPYVPVTLDTGGVVNATYLSGSGTSALVFRYTVATGNLDANGIAVGGSLAANGGTLRDGAGNDAISTLNSVGSTTGVFVDAVAPTVASVGVPANGSYIAGQNLDFTVNYSEAVTVNSGGGTPYVPITLDAGGLVHATYSSGSGTSALVFRYTVATGDLDANGITIGGSIAANGGTLKDNAGNDAGSTLNSVGSTASVLVDAVAPVVTSVGVPTNGSYLAGQNLDFIVNYSEAVTVNTAGGAPYVPITLDTGGVVGATYISGSGTTALVFRYTVATGNLDSNGIGVGSSAAANGGSIRDLAGNDASATLNSVGSTTGVLIDAVAPTVASVNVPVAGRYLAGQNLDFTVNYSEAVTVNSGGGTPYINLTLDTGGTVRASYISGSGSNALTFRYTVVNGNLDTNGVTVGSGITANGGTLRDAVGNDATLALSGVGSTGAILVDAVSPTVTSIDRAGSVPGNASSVAYTVTFSENVTGLDTSDLTLTPTGTAAGRVVSITAVSGSSYTVVVDTVTGNGTLRLDLNSSGTGIADTAGNSIGAGFTAGQTYVLDHSVALDNLNRPLMVASPPVLPTLSLEVASVQSPPPMPETPSSLTAFSNPGEHERSEAGRLGLVTFEIHPEAPAYISLSQPPLTDLGIQTVTAGQFFDMAPVGVLSRDLDGISRVVDIRLANGEALPDWLRFDPISGTLNGQAPGSFGEDLTLQIVTLDRQGFRHTSTLQLSFRHADPGGRVPLNEQLERHGRSAHQKQSDTFLKHLHNAARRRAHAA